MSETMNAIAHEMDGVTLIAKERRRQKEVEGWTPEHDNQHIDGELALAAACYAWPAPRPVEVKKAWPWDRQWWKPEMPDGFTPEAKRAARIRVLVKAGALIAAEIDRLSRGA